MFKTQYSVKGWTEMQLRDKNGKVKRMFQENEVWKLFKSLFNVDLKIPYLFGNWTTLSTRHNLITTVGKKLVADQLGGTVTTPATCLAIGIGTTGAAAGNTTLESEIVTYGGERGAATVTNATTTTTGDTEQWAKIFTITAGGTFAITEEGILNNVTSGGVLVARQVFSAVNVVAGDSLAITHKIQVTTS